MDHGNDSDSANEGNESDEEVNHSEKANSSDVENDERITNESDNEEHEDDEKVESGSENEDEEKIDSGSEDEEKVKSDDEGNEDENKLVISSDEDNNGPLSPCDKSDQQLDDEVHISDVEASGDGVQNTEDCDQENSNDICDNEDVNENKDVNEEENTLSSMELDSDYEKHNEDGENKSDSEDGKQNEENGSDVEDAEKEKKELIANIFGDSDEEHEGGEKKDRSKKKTKRARIASDDSDSEPETRENKIEEEEEEEGKLEENSSETEIVEDHVTPPKSKGKQKKSTAHVVSDGSDDEGNKNKEPFVSDFDLMMQRKRENARKRKRKNVDIINDSDDLIAEIISQMKQAAEEDRELNKQKKTATKKLKILPLVMSQLRKHDLKMAFLDQGVLNAMADWLAPLPDRSLPNLKIREGMLKQLLDFPAIDQSLLKSSGIGRAVMYLYKHPRELKENRVLAGKIIKDWASVIFNVTTDYHSLTKEEREQRDYDHVPKRKKLRDESAKQEVPKTKDLTEALDENEVKLRPGDKGWVPRARVPMPSNKDYVVRPKWNVEADFGRSSVKKPLNRFEKHMKTMQEKKRNSKAQRAVTISIEGRNMAI